MEAFVLTKLKRLIRFKKKHNHNAYSRIDKTAINTDKKKAYDSKEQILSVSRSGSLCVRFLAFIKISPPTTIKIIARIRLNKRPSKSIAICAPITAPILALIPK